MTGCGFIGSLAGVLCAPFLPADWHVVLVLLGVIIVSVAISDLAEKEFGQKDDQRIVIDEWAGYLIAVAFMAPTSEVLFVGFVLFRFFDARKPLGINRFASLPGGWGIVMDDVAAGVCSNVLLHAYLAARMALMRCTG